jgi:two-component system LytT family response regulator
VDARLRLIVADDERPARVFLLNLVHALDDVVVVGVAETGDEALDLIERHHPDVVLLDIHMPGLDGFGVVHLLANATTPLVVFVTAFEDYRDLAAEVGAFDYLLKPVDPRNLRHTLTCARERSKHVPTAERA